MGESEKISLIGGDLKFEFFFFFNWGQILHLAPETANGRKKENLSDYGRFEKGMTITNV